MLHSSHPATLANPANLANTPLIPLMVQARPFCPERVVRTLPTGLTVADVVGEMVRLGDIDPRYQPFLQVWVDGCHIPAAAWPMVRPKAGVPVMACVVPQGGGGGGGKSTARVFMALAVMAAAAWAAAALGPMLAGAMVPAELAPSMAFSSFVSGVVGGVVSTVGGLLVNALVPLPSAAARAPVIDGGPLASPSFAITGMQNRSNPYGAIPKIYGRRRVFPTYGARYYSETVGNDRYFRCLFTVGYGPLKIEDICIGETPITAFENVELEIRSGQADDQPLTLFTKSISEESLSVILTKDGGWQQRVTDPDCDEISFDIAFPRGLCRFLGDGSRAVQSVDVEVQYAPVGTAADSPAWQPAAWADSESWLKPDGIIHASDDSNSQVLRGGRWLVPKGQYAVRARRVTADTTDNTVMDLVQMAVLRSIKQEDPVKIPGMARIALRIKASEQLNGVINQLSCVATSILADWDGTAWVERPTSNPAAIFRDILMGPANKRPLPVSRLHWPSLEEWASACAADAPQGTGARWTFDAVIDSPTTVRDLLIEVASAGRASPAMPGGKFGVVRDRADTIAVQNFTPRNSWSYSGSKSFAEPPHGVKVRFVNPDAGWQEDQVIVYADGYSPDNASLFDTLDMMSCLSADQAWREGRYHLAVRILRPETHQLSVDVEALRCTAGDLVQVSHDVILVGLASGRINSLTLNAQGRVEAITLDEPVTMAADVSYGVRVRCADGTNIVASVVTQAGQSHDLFFTTAQSGPEVGNLVQFGEAGRESMPMLVKAIAPAENHSARLTLHAAAPAVHLADQGTIPPFDSGISQSVPLAWQTPPLPTVTDVRSDEAVLLRLSDGSLQSRIVVTFSGKIPDEGALQAQYKLSDSAQWIDLPDLKRGQTLIIAPVTDNRYHDVRLRMVTNWGVTSGWETIANHLVIGKTTPPPSPSGFAVDVTPSGVRLRWLPVTVADFSTYELRVHTNSLLGAGPDDQDPWDSADLVARLSATDLDLGPLPTGDYQWMIRAIDTIGLNSPSVMVSATIAPPGLPAITTQVIDNFVALSYPTIPGSHLIKHYELKRGPFLAQAEIIETTDSAFSAVFEPASGLKTYWVRAVDIAANPGPWAKVSASVSQPIDYTLMAEWTSAMDGLTTNGVAVNGVLLAPVNSAQSWQQHFDVNGWQSIADQVAAGYPIYAQPGLDHATYQQVFDYGAVVNNVLITVSLTKTPLAGTVTVVPLLEVSLDGQDWATVANGWQAAAAAARYLRISLDITAADPASIALIELAVSLDVHLRNDSGTVAVNAGDPSGTWVPFNSSFLDVSSITVTPQGTTPITAVYDFVDIPNPLGFKVLLFDRSGARVSGAVSWTARGY